MKTNTTTNTNGLNALRTRILIQYDSMNDFAEKINVKLDKLNGKEEFCLEDIMSIRSALNLKANEVNDFFFSDFEPSERKSTMINVFALESMVRRLDHIESGLIALDMMVNGKIKDVGETISNEDFQDGFSFIMGEVMEKVSDLRADITSKYAQGYTRATQI